MRRDRQAEAVQLATGVRLAYVQQGDASGLPVLLLHPWGESLGCFDRLLPMLPARVRALAMDQRGHGDSGKPAEGYALADYAADIEAFMDALDLHSAILLGSSSGGYVAQQVAVGRPDRVAGLVLVGSPLSLRGRPAFADDVERLTDPVDRDWAERSLRWFPLCREVPDWYLRDRVDDAVRMPARVWRKALAGLTAARPPTETGTITAPTLIIWGARDELLSWADEQALAAAIPGSQLAVYQETGHLVLWEQPERVAGDLAGFAERLRSARHRAGRA
jgi:pimeloyl-ACP methyl ester carboxylesterase